MLTKLTKNTRISSRFNRISIVTLMLSMFIGGCNHGDDDPSSESQVHFMLAAVDEGTCAIYAENRTIATAITEEGVATFKDVPADLGMALIECYRGVYEDEASGEFLTAGATRSYVDITSSAFTTAVTPLTEIAVRVVEYYDLDPLSQYSAILANVAKAFGMNEFDLSTAIPFNLNLQEADGTAGGRYGVVLAALSQMQLDIEAESADEVIDTLVFGLANNGLFTSDEIRDSYFYALENMFDNPRIDPNLGTDEDLDALFHDVVLAPLASQVEYVDADHPESNDHEAFSTITAFETSTFDIVGTHLSLGLEVTLAGEPCLVYDLETMTDTNIDSKYNIMYADCPAQNEGIVELLVMDDGRLENTTEITVEAADTETTTQAKTIEPVLAMTTGSSYLLGYISAQAPGVTPDTSAEHNYTSDNLEIFDVAGVPVDLIDSSGAVLASTVTDFEGYYQFSDVPESTALRIVVKAQIEKQRTTANVGPQYSFAIRDNTSAGAIKKLYTLTSSAVTTNAVAGSDNRFDVVAKIGFDGQGDVNGTRESAPFAILRIVKSAADKLEALNPNIEMPPLNLYWSENNVAVEGDLALGQIGTSYYNGSGLSQGVFILGKANADTDEFDKGVIGHEFGHYLQAQLSYSDSPGGSHGDSEYKDASLAYGEGYGTAVGGLLSGSHYYCDTSGEKQRDGVCNDLNKPVPATDANGFYSEASIIYLMFGMGNIDGKGFTEFFDAVSKMKTGIHSATIFAFLDHYLNANSDVEPQVKALMATSNVKTREPFGVYPSGTAVDPKISAEVNKGDASQGANDLDQIYTNITLSSSQAPSSSDGLVVVSSNSPTFCLNNNLHGANSQNGLGMRRRAVFTANFTGKLVLSAINKFDHFVSDHSAHVQVRDSDGNKVSVFGYNHDDDYFGQINVVSGKTYSVVLSVVNPEVILKGSQCGYYFELSRIAA